MSKCIPHIQKLQAKFVYLSVDVEVLDGELKNLAKKGYGYNTAQSQPLPAGYEKKILDSYSSDEPEGLLNRRLHKDEVVEGVDEDGHRYFGWLPTPEKNNSGVLMMFGKSCSS